MPGADAVPDSQGAFMPGDKTMVTHLASALEVVVEVIEFYSDGNRIPGPVCLSGMGFESYFKTQFHDLVITRR